MALSSAKHILTKYPLVKGMLFYVITWPTGNIIQQTIDGKRWGNDFFTLLSASWHVFHIHTNKFILKSETYDWKMCLRFACYGSLYVAPSLYGWVKLTSKIWPVTNVRTAIMKTVLEQLSYGPLATASFFFIISIMEHRTIEESKMEVMEKFWPTYKVRHSLEFFQN